MNSKQELGATFNFSFDWRQTISSWCVIVGQRDYYTVTLSQNGIYEQRKEFRFAEDLDRSFQFSSKVSSLQRTTSFIGVPHEIESYRKTFVEKNDERPVFEAHNNFQYYCVVGVIRTNLSFKTVQCLICNTINSFRD